MNPRSILRVVGVVVFAIGVAMIPAAVIAGLDGTADFVPLLISAGSALAVALLLVLGTRGKTDLSIKDGFFIVSAGWVAAGVFGAVPYVLSGVASPIDAFFESVSGFSTTGATIFRDIESLPRGILFWRSMTHWLGGMGIVVLSVAVLPFLGVGGMQLFKAEVPGPTADRLTPRIQSTAAFLWGTYLVLTVLETGLLMAGGGMDWFESICHTFGTVATGGFSTRNASIGAFGPYEQIVITLFMFLAGVNFSLHYWALRRRWGVYARDEEFRFYLVLALIATGFLWVSIYLNGHAGLWDGLRHSAFQAVSIMTTTGYGTADFLLWGPGAQILLFTLMFLGGCAGSTGGGMKQLRIAVLGKYGVREMKKLLHPHGIFRIKFSGKAVPDDVLLNILGFFLLYVAAFVVGALVVAATGVEAVTAIGASAACLGNIGPGLGDVGPASTYTALPGLAKGVLVFLMLLGRLELYTVLVLLTPMYWRKV